MKQISKELCEAAVKNVYGTLVRNMIEGDYDSRAYGHGRLHCAYIRGMQAVKEHFLLFAEDISEHAAIQNWIDEADKELGGEFVLQSIRKIYETDEEDEDDE